MSCAPFSKRKKVVADISVILSELTSVPLVNAVLFTKLRVLNTPGAKSQCSKRLPVVSNAVTWNSEHKFRCKLYVNPTNQCLESKHLKVSIRKESRGGKSFSKLGFVMVDLACFASKSDVFHQRKYILEGYSVKGRQDNSLLLLSVNVQLQTSDFTFSRPSEDVTKCIQCFSMAMGGRTQPIPPTTTTSDDVEQPDDTGSTSTSQDAIPPEKQAVAAQPLPAPASANSSPERQALGEIPDPAAVLLSSQQSSLDDPSLKKASRDDFSTASFDTLERKREMLYLNGTKHQLIQSTRMNKDEVVNGILQAFHQQGSAHQGS